MKTKLFLSLLAACALSAACTPHCRVVWSEGATDPESGKTVHSMIIENPPSGTDWTVWFCQFRTPVTMMEPVHGSIEHINGTLYRIIPTVDTKGGTMILKYESRALVSQCRAPEGFFLQEKGKKPVPLNVSYNFQPCEDVKSFEYTPVPTTAYDMIPRPKEVTALEGETLLADATVEEVQYVEGKPEGWYRITVDGKVAIEASDKEGALYAGVTLDNLRRNARGEKISNGVITDWPDMPYRGLMLDISRNFTGKEDLLKLIDLLAHYKVNRLHLHMGDDEGWRIEIEGLPELTSYGAFRGIPDLLEDGSIAETEALEPSYSGALDKNTRAPGNGYYSKADFIEILRYADRHGIRVIPEFDTPGHSRAAIKSMEKMAARTGDGSFLLSEPEDESKYVSVQDYRDNAINVALPSTYNFIEKVFEGLITLYKEAGVPLEAIHIGGDEVPDGAWLGSPACRALMESAGRTDKEWLNDYYVGRVLDIAEKHGVKIAGWQEVMLHLEPATRERLRKNLAFTNIWSVSRGKEGLAYEYANQGFNVVLSNSPTNYFDMAYNYGKKERGHSWTGYVDERRSFSLQPYNLYRSVRWDDRGGIVDISKADEGKAVLLPQGRSNIIGVQGQLWAETIRSFDHVTYYLFPKALGTFERGWNATPSWSTATVSDDPAFMDDFNHFFSIVTDNEYPYYESLGVSFHRN